MQWFLAPYFKKSIFSTDAPILRGIKSVTQTAQKMTNDVFLSEYEINHLWLPFIKGRMHANNDVFQLRFPKGSGALEDSGDTL